MKFDVMSVVYPHVAYNGTQVFSPLLGNCDHEICYDQSLNKVSLHSQRPNDTDSKYREAL